MQTSRGDIHEQRTARDGPRHKTLPDSGVSERAAQIIPPTIDAAVERECAGVSGTGTDPLEPQRARDRSRLTLTVDQSIITLASAGVQRDTKLSKLVAAPAIRGTGGGERAGMLESRGERDETILPGIVERRYSHSRREWLDTAEDEEQRKQCATADTDVQWLHRNVNMTRTVRPGCGSPHWS